MGIICFVLEYFHDIILLMFPGRNFLYPGINNCSHIAIKSLCRALRQKLRKALWPTVGQWCFIIFTK
jgi:hypothetical protein